MIRTIGLLLLILVSCGKKEQLPKLNETKMRAVVWDLMRADEMLSYYAQNDTSYKPANFRKPLYERIFRQHRVTQDQFLQTMDYYEKHPSDELKILLDSLTSMAKREVDATDSLKKPSYPVPVPNRVQQIRDSLRQKN